MMMDEASIYSNTSNNSVKLENGNSSPVDSNGNPCRDFDYLQQLLKDKQQIGAFPNLFVHLDRLLEEEIFKTRAAICINNANGGQMPTQHSSGDGVGSTFEEPMILPDPIGDVSTITEKVWVPVKQFPDYNFVGRILGPRGLTAKQLEQETGCKIMVRGQGSMRDKKKEEQMRGKPNWEHLSDPLHVLLQVEDTENRGKVKIKRGIEAVKKLLVPAPEGEDELKRKQLMELAIINGTYRPANATSIKLQTPRLLAPMSAVVSQQQRSAMATLGAPLIMSSGVGGIPSVSSASFQGSGGFNAATLQAQLQAAALLSGGGLSFGQQMPPLVPAQGTHPDYQQATAAAQMLYGNATQDQLTSLLNSQTAALQNSALLNQFYPSFDSQAGAILSSAGRMQQLHGAAAAQQAASMQQRTHPYQRVSGGQQSYQSGGGR